MGATDCAIGADGADGTITDGTIADGAVAWGWAVGRGVSRVGGAEAVGTEVTGEPVG